MVWVTFITLLSKILGLIREVVIAGYFGATADTDAFFVAFRLPDVFYNSLLNFLVAIAFIPVFSEYITAKNKKLAWKLARSTFLAIVFVFGLCSFVLMVFAPRIITIIAPGLDGPSFGNAVLWTRVMSPIIMFGGLLGLLKSILNASGKYLLPASIPILYNLVVILAVLFFGRQVGVAALAFGVLVAALLQFGFLMVPVKQAGFTFIDPTGLNSLISVKRNISESGVLRVANLAGPVALALVIGQVVPIVEVGFASKISDGAISYLGYAQRIFTLPEQIFTIAISTILFPALAADAARSNTRELIKKFSISFRLTVFAIVPVTLILTMYSELILGLLLGRGAFDATSVEETSKVLSAYAISLLAVCIRSLVTYVFFALQNSKLLLIWTALMVPVNIILDLLLIPRFSVVGIALGASITTLLHTGALLIYLQRSIGAVDGWRITATFLKIIACAMAMTLAILTVQANMRAATSLSPFLQKFYFLLIISISGLTTYLLAARVLRVEEASFVWELVWGAKRSPSV